MKFQSRKFIITAIILVAVISMFCIGINAAEAKTEGTTSKGLTWKYDTVNDVLTLKGTADKIGTIDEFTFKTKVKTIVFPDKLTEISEGQFSGYTALTSVNIPAKVTTIKKNAFKGCTSLKTVTFAYGSELQYINDNAFDGCKALTTIELPKEVKEIGSQAFMNCSALTSIKFSYGSKLNKIGKEAFAGCTALAELDVSGTTLTEICEIAFKNCTALKTVKLPKTFTTLGTTPFYGCNALATLTVAAGGKFASSGNCLLDGKTVVLGCKNSTVPATATAIAAYAFAGYDTLVQYDISNATELTTVNAYAFYGCKNLVSVKLPKKITTVSADAFNGCTSLAEIVIDAETGIYSGVTAKTCIGTSYTFETHLTVNGDHVYIKSDKGNYYVRYLGNAASVSISTPFTAYDKSSINYFDIAPYAFADNKTLQTVSIPNVVTVIGAHAFENNTKLTAVTIPTYTEKIGEYAFNGCGNVTKFSIGEGSKLVEIGKFAFAGMAYVREDPLAYCTKLTKIGDGAFSGWNSLTSVTLHCVIEVTDYSVGVFANCPKLFEVVNKVPGYSITSNPALGLVNIGNGINDNRDGKSHIVKTTDGFVFFTNNTGSYLLDYTGTASSVTVPESFKDYSGKTVTGFTVYKYAFYNNSTMTALTVPASVGKIMEGAINTCSALTTLTVKATTVCPVVESGAVKNSKKITNLTVPLTGLTVKNVLSDNVSELTYVEVLNAEEIITGAFDGCKKLKTLVINNKKGYGNTETPAVIAKGALKDCVALESLTFAAQKAGSSYLGYLFGADSYTDSKKVPTTLKTVTVTGGNALDSYAFYKCANITSITVNNISGIGSYAFYGCSALTSLTIPETVYSIGKGITSGCTSLASINVLAANKYYTSAGNCIIDTATGTVIAGCKSSTIPALSNVTVIGDSAFYGCSGLTTITIPANIVTIKENAFHGCTGLKTVDMTNAKVKTIAPYAFYDCTSLADIRLANTVRKIGVGAFDNTGIYNNTAKWTDGVLYIATADNTGKFLITASSAVVGEYYAVADTTLVIADSAFNGISALKYVELPSSLAAIGSSAFSGTSVTSIYSKKYVTDWDEFKAKFAPATLELSGAAIYPVAFKGAYLTLENDFSINFVISDKLTDVKVKAEGKEAELEKITVSGYSDKGYNVYKLAGIIPYQIVDQFRLTIEYKDAQGKDHKSDVLTYGVRSYCVNKLNNNNSESDLKRLCADLLNYGAAAQKLKGYKTTTLANTGINYATPAYSELKAPASVASPISGEKADLDITSAALSLTERVTMQITVTLPKDKYTENKGATIKVWNAGPEGTIPNTSATVITVNDDTIENKNEYKGAVKCKVTSSSSAYTFTIDYTGLTVQQFNDQIKVELYNNSGFKTGRSLTYTINSYISAMYNASTISEIVKALYCYHASAENYSIADDADALEQNRKDFVKLAMDTLVANRYNYTEENFNELRARFGYASIDKLITEDPDTAALVKELLAYNSPVSEGNKSKLTAFFSMYYDSLVEGMGLAERQNTLNVYTLKVNEIDDIMTELDDIKILINNVGDPTLGINMNDPAVSQAENMFANWAEKYVRYFYEKEGVTHTYTSVNNGEYSLKSGALADVVNFANVSKNTEIINTAKSLKAKQQATALLKSAAESINAYVKKAVDACGYQKGDKTVTFNIAAADDISNAYTEYVAFLEKNNKNSDAIGYAAKSVNAETFVKLFVTAFYREQVNGYKQYIKSWLDGSDGVQTIFKEGLDTVRYVVDEDATKANADGLGATVVLKVDGSAIKNTDKTTFKYNNYYNYYDDFKDACVNALASSDLSPERLIPEGNVPKSLDDIYLRLDQVIVEKLCDNLLQKYYDIVFAGEYVNKLAKDEKDVYGKYTEISGTKYYDYRYSAFRTSVESAINSSFNAVKSVYVNKYASIKSSVAEKRLFKLGTDKVELLTDEDSAYKAIKADFDATVKKALTTYYTAKLDRANEGEFELLKQDYVDYIKKFAGIYGEETAAKLETKLSDVAKDLPATVTTNAVTADLFKNAVAIHGKKSVSDIKAVVNAVNSALTSGVTAIEGEKYSAYKATTESTYTDGYGNVHKVVTPKYENAIAALNAKLITAAENIVNAYIGGAGDKFRDSIKTLGTYTTTTSNNEKDILVAFVNSFSYLYGTSNKYIKYSLLDIFKNADGKVSVYSITSPVGEILSVKYYDKKAEFDTAKEEIVKATEIAVADAYVAIADRYTDVTGKLEDNCAKDLEFFFDMNNKFDTLYSFAKTLETKKAAALSTAYDERTVKLHGNDYDTLEVIREAYVGRTRLSLTQTSAKPVFLYDCGIKDETLKAKFETAVATKLNAKADTFKSAIQKVTMISDDNMENVFAASTDALNFAEDAIAELLVTAAGGQSVMDAITDSTGFSSIDDYTLRLLKNAAADATALGNVKAKLNGVTFTSTTKEAETGLFYTYFKYLEEFKTTNNIK